MIKKIRYNVFGLLKCFLFQVAGQCCKDDLVPVLSDLADFRAMEDSKDLTYLSEIEYTIGAAVKSMGPEIVLKTIPLQVNIHFSIINNSSASESCVTYVHYIFPVKSRQLQHQQKLDAQSSQGLYHSCISEVLCGKLVATSLDLRVSIANELHRINKLE